MIFSGGGHFTSALLVFEIFFFFFYEETNVFTYLHCYRMRNDFSEGTAFLSGDSEPPSKGRKEDVNIRNSSHNSSPRLEKRVVGALPPRALGSGAGLCLQELSVSPAPEQRPLPSWQMQPGGQAPAIRSMCMSDFPQHRCRPAQGKQAGSEWSDETAPWDPTEAEFRGPVLGRWLWGALPRLGGKRMGIEMRMFVNKSRSISLEVV